MSEPAEETMTKIDLPPGAEVPPPDGTSDPSFEVAAMGGKQGGVCCFFCCDYRRAVIIMSSISVFLGVFGIIGAIRGRQVYYEDEAVAEDIEAITDSYKTQNIVLSLIGFVFAGCSLFGSLKFRWNLVASAVVWALISFCLTILFTSKEFNEILDYLDNEGLSDDATESQIRRTVTFGYFLGALLAACWVYPSIWLVMELRSGIMTAETYPREKHSCCCV